MYANGHLKFWFDKTVQGPVNIQQTDVIRTCNIKTKQSIIPVLLLFLLLLHYNKNSSMTNTY